MEYNTNDNINDNKWNKYSSTFYFPVFSIFFLISFHKFFIEVFDIQLNETFVIYNSSLTKSQETNNFEEKSCFESA